MANSLEHILHEYVNNQVVISEDDRKVNVKMIEKIIKQKLIEKMREADDLFDELYGGIRGAGSYYENLKVGSADEFDLNVVLILPFALDQSQRAKSPVQRQRRRSNESGGPFNYKQGPTIGYYKIIQDNRLSGFAQYRLMRPLDESLYQQSEEFQDLFKLFDDEDGTRLSTEKIKGWWQSVVENGLYALQNDRYAYSRRRGPSSIEMEMHGPAATLTLYMSNDEKIDVDLVPVIPLFHPVSMSIQTSTMFEDIPENKKFGFLIPKAPSLNIMPNDHDVWSFFRVSIPEAERHLMAKRGSAKKLIRIFKALRDEEEWNFLVSHHIKTLFLWKLAERPDDRYWKDGRIKDLFIMMLQNLRGAMDRMFIPTIFFPKSNLLQDMPSQNGKIVRDRVDEIIEMVKDNRLDDLQEVFPGEETDSDEDDDYGYYKRTSYFQ